MSVPELLDALQPVLAALRGHTAADPEAASKLNAQLPLTDPAVARVEALVRRGLEEGWLCPREGDNLRYGRLAKAGEGTGGFSIDAVDMAAAGLGHAHPAGEFDLCFAVEGDPVFDGRPPGWTVYPPRSWHIPTVTGGRMAILYFLPRGEIAFGAPQ